jgi:hypothetical protein
LHFLTAIGGTIRGRGQGRSWWLQGTFCIPSKATKLVGQIKAKEKVQSLDFQTISTRFQLFHKSDTLPISPVVLDETPRFDFRRTALLVAG